MSRSLRPLLFPSLLLLGCGGDDGASSTSDSATSGATATNGTTGETSTATTTSDTSGATGSASGGQTDSATTATSTTDATGTGSTSAGTGATSTATASGSSTGGSGSSATSSSTSGGATGSSGSTGGVSGSSGGISGTSGGTTGGMKQCAPVTPGNEDCLAPALHITCDDDDDPYHAIGLNCPGDATNSTPIKNETFEAPDDDTWFTITQFGSDPLWQPKEGNRMLIMSTGNLDAPDANGVLTQAAGKTENLFQMMNPNKTDNPDDQPLPDPMHPIDGSGGTPFMDCDCVNDCSDTLEAQWTLGDEQANDLIWFRFDLDVPQGTYGYEFDFAWFSAEHPEWVNTKYNDVFVVWSTSESYTGNITFINGQPLTVTALDAEMKYKNNAKPLQDTGFEGVGGGTGWFTALGSVKPGETFTLAWALFDMGDEVLDTAVLVDNWRWTCGGCDPRVNGCGVIPQ